jgi:formylglycine-generating enzyme required for sulfatase activity
MVSVAAGSFWMGCNDAVDTECQADGREAPYHQVWVPAFKIDKHETTVSDFAACVTNSGCTAADTGSGCNFNVAGKENHPINCVDWNRAKAYCTWVGKRLPAEAEWEKTARGTDGRKYPWGNDVLDCNRAVHSVSPCSNSGTATVGSKPTGVSPYGAMDMVGNVWEFTEDDWHSGYTGAPNDGSPWIDTPRAEWRVYRGGAFSGNNPAYLRSSVRAQFPFDTGSNTLGFRCAISGN